MIGVICRGIGEMRGVDTGRIAILEGVDCLAEDVEAVEMMKDFDCGWIAALWVFGCGWEVEEILVEGAV